MFYYYTSKPLRVNKSFQTLLTHPFLVELFQILITLRNRFSCKSKRSNIEKELF